MTRTKYILMATLAALLAAAPARASDAPQTFGIVDTSKVIRASEAAQNLSTELEGKRKEFAGELSKQQEAVKAEIMKFEKQRATLSKEEAAAQHKHIDDKVEGVQKTMREREALLDRALSSSMNDLHKDIGDIVGDIAKERNLSAVLTQDAVMLSVPQMDLTEEVVKRLNDKVKKIPIDWAALEKENKDKKAG